MRRLLGISIAVLVPLALVAPSSVSQSSWAVSPPTNADHSTVRPIDWSSFEQSIPQDSDSLRVRKILLNGNKYALTAWWDEQGYSSQSGPYLDLGSRAGSAYQAFGLAVSLATNAYDSDQVGVPRGDAEEATLKLVRSIAISHRASTAGGWGGGWQDALWAANAGYAGWLMWNDLSDADREHVRRMVEWEANRFQDYAVPYYRDESGNIIRPGNSPAEESAWNAELMQLATAMMPNHQNWKRWMDKNLVLMISAFSRPEDVNNRSTIINGKSLAEWLDGSNIESNGSVVNHNLIHPQYMTTVKLNLMGVFAYSLAGMPTPKAAFLNADMVYASLVDAHFPSPPYEPPGGTIYVDGSSDIYYPEGSDWSTSRKMIFAEVDVLARAYGLDDLASQDAAYWEDLHAGAALAQQERHPDGKMYAPGEHTSQSGDGGAAPGRAWLAKWITHQGALRVTNQAYPESSARLTIELEPQQVNVQHPGDSADVAAIVTNEGPAAATDTRVQLELPEGWRVAQSTDGNTVMPPNTSSTWTWTITTAADAPEGVHPFRAVANYDSAGGPAQATSEAANVVIEGDNVALLRPVVAFSDQHNDTNAAARNINDGSVGSDSRGWAARGNNHWVVIDLERTCNLSGLQITGGYPNDHVYVKDYIIYGSLTGEFNGEETVLDSGTVPTLRVRESWEREFDPTDDVRFVKFFGETTYGTYIFVGELELYGECGE